MAQRPTAGDIRGPALARTGRGPIESPAHDVDTDRLTEEQVRHLSSWEEDT
jgi:hypothetical protein